MLSGDYNGNDPNYSDDYGYDFTTQQENAHHVVIAAGPMGDAILDGFTLTGGHADADTPLALNGETIAGHHGGGLYMAGGTLPVERVTFLYNFSETHGGGMYIDGENPYITACLFDYNVAPNGAGLYAGQASPAVTNTVFFQNRASVAGGGMYFDGGAPVLTNLTIMRNYAEEGNSGGIYNSFSATAIRNTIIVNNNGGVYDTGGASSVAYSFVQDMPGGENGNLDGSMYFGNMMFPGEYGGDFAAAYPMFAGMGSNDYFAAGQTPDLSGIVTDYEGGQRLYGTVDMGAVESTMLPFPMADANGIVYVKQDGLGIGTSWDNATNNIQDAMFADGVQQIWVAGGIYTPAYSASETMTGITTGTPRDRTFLLMPDIKIYGGFAGNEASLAERDLSVQSNASILNGDLNGDDIEGNFESRFENSYHVVLSIGPVGEAVLDGFTIVGGNADGTGNTLVNDIYIREDSGGGMYIYDSSPVLSHMIFKNNYGAFGGGVFTQATGIMMSNSLFYNNVSSYGGAICNWESSPVITNVTITANEGFNGAGIYNFASNPAINNTIVYGNAGDGVNNQNSQPLWKSSFLQDFDMNVGWNPASGINGGGNRGYDPMFNDPANDDYSLHPSSIAVNLGDNSLFDDAANAVDLVGKPRLLGPIDVGAYESQVILPCSVYTAWIGTQWTNGAPTSEMYYAEIYADYDSSVHGEITACSIHVQNGTVVIASGDVFKIQRAVLIADPGNLIIENNASLVQVDYVNNYGEAVVHRNSSQLFRQDYTMWSSPMQGQEIRGFSPETVLLRFYTYNTATDHYEGMFATEQDAEDVNFATGKGYLIRMPNGAPQAGYVEGTTAITYDGTFTGKLNNGDINVPVVPRDEIQEISGYNAIGNPYPSPISIDAFFAGNAGRTDGVIYLWRKKNAAAETSAYCTVNSEGEFVGNEQAGADDPGGILQTGQGFIVKALATTISFNNGMRSASIDNDSSFFRMNNDAPHSGKPQDMAKPFQRGYSFGPDACRV